MSDTVTLRVWIADHAGNELNHCYIEVPAEELENCAIEDLGAVEEAKQELIDDCIDQDADGVERVQSPSDGS